MALPGISRVITVKVCLGQMLTLGTDDLTPVHRLREGCEDLPSSLVG